MFLPQVVKSARVMKAAVAHLLPFIEANKGSTESIAKGKIVMATVKGDVHDIGKNIAGVVLQCNNYEIIDMGVMVPCEDILNKAEEVGAHIIGLSGLITPSLDEMVHVARRMEERGMKLPLLIGGATTSLIHTAIKIDPVYSGPVIHVKDASQAVGITEKLMNPAKKDLFLVNLAEEMEKTRQARASRDSQVIYLPLKKVQAKRFTPPYNQLPEPAFLGTKVFNPYPLEKLVPYIDWSFFFLAWDLKGTYPAILDDPKMGDEAGKLHSDANRILNRIVKENLLTAQGVAGFWPAEQRGDDIILFSDDEKKSEIALLPTLRQQRQKEKTPYYLSLSDYIAPAEAGIKDYLGMFTVTAGVGLENAVKTIAEGDDYLSIMVKILADRLAEAFAEVLHHRVRREFWPYSQEGDLSVKDILAGKYQGIRPAPGYPSCPDHREKELIFKLMEVDKNTGISLTESKMMTPESSVSGYYFSHPESKYFSVGKIDKDQVKNFGYRKKSTVKDTEKWLQSVLSYK